MKGAKGFTLIELVIALAVLAIIIGIAIPAYTDQVTKTRRAEGKAAVMNVAQALERCYTRFSAYNDGNCNVALPTNSENDWYEVDAGDGGVTATTFELEATPQDSQATNDTKCATLGLTHTGEKSVSGSGSVSDCW